MLAGMAREFGARDPKSTDTPAVGGVTVTAALADLSVLATLLAVTVWFPVVAGAVYSPLVVIRPVAVLPPTVPSTNQVTAVFVVPLTVAMNCC